MTSFDPRTKVLRNLMNNVLIYYYSLRLLFASDARHTLLCNSFALRNLFTIFFFNLLFSSSLKSLDGFGFTYCWKLVM